MIRTSGGYESRDRARRGERDIAELIAGVFYLSRVLMDVQAIAPATRHCGHTQLVYIPHDYLLCVIASKYLIFLF